MEQFLRTSLVLGSEAVEKLKNKRVAVFGIGGVGGYVAEALARSGVGAIDLIDNDTVSLSNINRQIIALHSTVGRLKTDVMEERILDICPDIKVTKHNLFFMPETSGEIDFSQFDYVVDAIDTVSGKLEIIRLAKENGVPVISSMGTGNKLSPLEFKIADISKTKVCPLAKAMRLELKKRGIKNVKVLYSEEEPVSDFDPVALEKVRAENPERRSVPGSVAFVPSVAGLAIAGEVIKDLIK